MAARLTVVVSQSAARDASASDVEETLVAELMMARGMDATMVGPLEFIQSDDTDFLCISSFNYNFVIVSWLPTHDIQQHLDRLGLHCRVVSLNNESAAMAGALGKGKSVFHLQLDHRAEVPRMVGQLQAFLNQRQVQTVSISLDHTGDQGAGAVANDSQAVGETINQRTAPMAPEKVEDESAHRAGNQPLSPPQAAQAKHDRPKKNAEAQPEASDPDDEEWAQLDQLVDDLDALDL